MSARMVMASCLEHWSGTGRDDARPENKKPSLRPSNREGSMGDKRLQQPKARPQEALAGYLSSTVTNFAQPKPP